MVQCFHVLMESTPDGIDPPSIIRKILTVAGVISVHDLHVWSLSVGKPSLSVHVVAAESARCDTVLVEIQQQLSKFDIHHATIQIESPQTKSMSLEEDVGLHIHG